MARHALLVGRPVYGARSFPEGRSRRREREDGYQSSRREGLCRETTAAKHYWLSSEPDPRATLNDETRQEVHEQVHRLVGKWRGGLVLAAIEKDLAARVARGQQMWRAVREMTEYLQIIPGVARCAWETREGGWTHSCSG